MKPKPQPDAIAAAVESARDPRPIKEDEPLIDATTFHVLTTCIAIDAIIERLDLP